MGVFDTEVLGVEEGHEVEEVEEEASEVSELKGVVEGEGVEVPLFVALVVKQADKVEVVHWEVDTVLV